MLYNYACPFCIMHMLNIYKVYIIQNLPDRARMKTPERCELALFMLRALTGCS